MRKKTLRNEVIHGCTPHATSDYKELARFCRHLNERLTSTTCLSAFVS